MDPARTLLGIGYYRSQSAPDLALYLGEHCYAGLDAIWCRLGITEDGKPYVDHSGQEFESSFAVNVCMAIKGKLATREAHVRRVSVIRAVWSGLSCASRGFAKSPLDHVDHVEFMRSFIKSWLTEPRDHGRSKQLTLPGFIHTDLSRAVSLKERPLHSLSAAERQTLIADLESQGLDAQQVASALGCSVKTVRGWRRISGLPLPVDGQSTGDPQVEALVDMAMELTHAQRQLLARRIQSK